MHGISKDSHDHSKLEESLSLVYPEDREMMKKFVMSTTEQGQTASAEYRIMRPDGSVRWINASISVTNLVDVDGPVQVTIFTDITETKEANNQLRFLNDSAHDIIAQPDNDKAITDTLGNILNYFSGDRSYIMEINPDQNTTSSTYEVCAEGIASRKTELLDITVGISGYQPGQMITIKDVEKMNKSHAKAKRLLKRTEFILLLSFL